MPFVSESYLAAISPQQREHLLRIHIPLGYHPETGDRLLLPETDRYAGTYVLGVQGVGKSGLLENLIAHDIQAQNAVIVVDPHGDLSAHCLAQLPPDRLATTYVLDMEDEAYPFGVNVFAVGKLETDVARSQAVERIMHVFEVLWEDVLSQQHLPRYVRAATHALLANPGATLVDMYAFLRDTNVRHRMLRQVTDHTVAEFWQSDYEELSPAERARRVQPLVNRLEALFMGRSLVRNLLGQRQNTISFRTAIENREIIFIRLPIKTMKQDAQLVGTIIMAHIHAAVFSFSDLPESKRPGVSLYVDEFQHFATPDFNELFTEGRKFGVKVVVAHQYRNQLPGYLQDSTMTARTKICFQTTPEDGREMAHVFPAQEETIKPEDINAHPVEYLLTYGSEHAVVQTFVETYLRPLQAQKRGNRVEIDHFAYDWINNKQLDKPRVPDPTPYLDHLLYDVMCTRSAHQPIPPYAVVGFANCGHDFYSHVIGIAGNDQLLLPHVRFPQALVVQTTDGNVRWTRRPEGSLEQLYHFIFHLRMTMFALAEVPIGKKSAPSTSVVGQMLMSLPRRAAFVRSAETIGVIYTDTTPEKVTDKELAERIETILTQTRKKYCYPRVEVERQLAQGSTPDTTAPKTKAKETAPSSLPRWEELEP